MSGLHGRVELWTNDGLLYAMKTDREAGFEGHYLPDPSSLVLFHSRGGFAPPHGFLYWPAIPAGFVVGAGARGLLDSHGSTPLMSVLLVHDLARKQRDYVSLREFRVTDDTEVPVAGTLARMGGRVVRLSSGNEAALVRWVERGILIEVETDQRGLLEHLLGALTLVD